MSLAALALAALLSQPTPLADAVARAEWADLVPSIDGHPKSLWHDRALAVFIVGQGLDTLSTVAGFDRGLMESNRRYPGRPRIGRLLLSKLIGGALIWASSRLAHRIAPKTADGVLWFGGVYGAGTAVVNVTKGR